MEFSLKGTTRLELRRFIVIIKRAGNTKYVSNWSEAKKVEVKQREVTA